MGGPKGVIKRLFNVPVANMGIESGERLASYNRKGRFEIPPPIPKMEAPKKGVHLNGKERPDNNVG
jgi:hypothetical protein